MSEFHNHLKIKLLHQNKQMFVLLISCISEPNRMIKKPQIGFSLLENGPILRFFNGSVESIFTIPECNCQSPTVGLLYGASHSSWFQKV